MQRKGLLRTYWTFMPNRRIVILTQYFPPEMGAPQSRLYETAMGLNRLGWDVRVITSLPNYPTGKIFPAYRGRLYVRESLDGIPIHRYWLYASNSKRAFPRILNIISFSLSALWAVFFIWRFRPAWLIAESPPLLTGLTGWWLSRLSGSKLVLNVSDIWPLSAAELGALKKGSLLYRLLESLERFLYKQSFACMGQSQEIVDHLKLHGATRSWLYRNGVNCMRFEAPAGRVFERPLKIVYAGLLGVAQGMLSLCKQLEFDSRQFELHLYGAGAERLTLEEYLLKNPSRGIVLHEPIGRDNVPNMLAQYDLTLIPLVKPIYGAVPSKIYEAMAAGLPILFAGGGEGAQIVESYQVGWTCPPSDFKAMKLLFEQIAELPDSVLLKYRENGIRAANEVFDRKIQITHLHARLTEE